ncbi:hypothetical protein Taro_022022 [Colocasia esculenta]|uniref:Uncharacterized protein n=1 Tax=Colocasia esculenta TaxID=4460 RepID=A0A843UT86_COLES|nr:hypothetical protein [Colocasia esculenta]
MGTCAACWAARCCSAATCPVLLCGGTEQAPAQPLALAVCFEKRNRHLHKPWPRATRRGRELMQNCVTLFVNGIVEDKGFLCSMVEIQGTLLKKLSDICDIVDAACDLREEVIMESLLDLPVWGSPRRRKYVKVAGMSVHTGGEAAVVVDEENFVLERDQF